jgi:hypothetical protein
VAIVAPGLNTTVAAPVPLGVMVDGENVPVMPMSDNVSADPFQADPLGVGVRVTVTPGEADWTALDADRPTVKPVAGVLRVQVSQLPTIKLLADV